MDAKKIKTQYGYVLNKETGKLEKYEFISARFTFQNDNKPIYRCKLGGKEMEIEDDFDVYDSEREFVFGNINDYPSYVYFHSCGLYDNGLSAWYLEDGDAVPINRKDIPMEYKNNKLSFADGKKYYNTRNAVFYNNDYIVVDENGNETRHESYNSKIILTDKQNELLDKLSELISEIVHSNIELLYDRGAGSLVAFNNANVRVVDRWKCDDSEPICDALQLDSARYLNAIADTHSGDYAVEIE